jgi:3-dehydroquinate dehydratase
MRDKLRRSWQGGRDIVAAERERFEILMEDIEKKFDLVIEGLTSLRDDFKELRRIVGAHEEILNTHEISGSRPWRERFLDRE